MLALSYAAVVIGAYLVAEVAGYITHALAHLRCMGPLNRAHMRHHTRYAPANFIQDRYVDDGFGPWYAPAFITASVIAFCLLPIGMACAAVLTFVAVAVVNDKLHDSYHVGDHPFTRFRWHRRLRALHYVHHKHVTKNVGIYAFWIDRLLHRFRSIDAGTLAALGAQLGRFITPRARNRGGRSRA